METVASESLLNLHDFLLYLCLTFSLIQVLPLPLLLLQWLYHTVSQGLLFSHLV